MESFTLVSFLFSTVQLGVFFLFSQLVFSGVNQSTEFKIQKNIDRGCESTNISAFGHFNLLLNSMCAYIGMLPYWLYECSGMCMRHNAVVVFIRI